MIGVVSAVRDLVRLREISRVLVRHGFGEIVTRARFGRKKEDPTGPSNVPELSEEDAQQGEVEKTRMSTAERIRRVLEELGPTFIKLGQIASTRTDLLPPEVIGELIKLQDAVPPAPFEEVKRSIEESLGASLDQIYVSFDEVPLATASIGQVHRATLRTDDGVVDVAVKVQRPNVSATVARDLEILHFMAAAMERAIPETKIYSPCAMVQQFDRSITAELNFTIEAENAERFAQNFAGDEMLRFPIPYKQASSKHVLTLEYFDGKKIDSALADGANGPLIAKRSVALIVKMIFDDGFFHADPHPGNIILMGTTEAPVIGLIDLGMVGRLSPELRDRTIDLMVAAVRKDSYAVADALFVIGRPTKKIDMRAYRTEVALLAEKYIGRPMKDLDLPGMVRDLIQGSMKFGLEVPPDFMLVGKCLMTLEGIGKKLDPNLDLTAEAGPHFLELLRKRYSPQRIGNDLWRGFEQLSRASYDFPIQMREVMDDLRQGRLHVRTEDKMSASAASVLGKRLFSSIAFASLTLSGAYLLAREQYLFAVIFFLLAAGAWARDVVRKG